MHLCRTYDIVACLTRSLPRSKRPAATAARLLCALAGGLALVLSAGATDYYVNHETGDDTLDGLSAVVETAERGPFKTILRAIKMAAAGDTVHLAPTERPYPESVKLYTYPTWYHPGGEPGKPLTIDGHGATVTGAEPCPPEGWKPWKGRVYRRDDFPTTGGLMIDGARVHGIRAATVLAPGDWLYAPATRHLYWHPAATPLDEVQLIYPDAEPETIDPKRWGRAGPRGVVRLVGLDAPAALVIAGERTAAVTVKERLEPGQWTNEDGTLYYHLPEGREFADMEIEAVVRVNGVQIAGSTSHVVVRNLHTTRFSNDGFNIHENAKDLLFQNIIATYCFDEGYSAHTDVESEIDGATFLFNASGLTNVHRAHTRARNLLIAFNDGIGYAGMDESIEEVENLILIDNGRQLSGVRLTARNVLAINTGTGSRPGGFELSGEVVLERLTAMGVHGVRLNAGAAVALRDTVFGGHGDWHIRGDDPDQRLATVEQLVMDPALTISSVGSRHPWRAKPLSAWLAEHHPGQVRTADIPAFDAFMRGDGQRGIPGGEGAGCSPELIEKAVDFLLQHTDRWNAVGASAEDAPGHRPQN